MAYRDGHQPQRYAAIKGHNFAKSLAIYWGILQVYEALVEDAGGLGALFPSRQQPAVRQGLGNRRRHLRRALKLDASVGAPLPHVLRS